MLLQSEPWLCIHYIISFMRQVDISERLKMMKTLMYSSENILFFLKTLLIQKSLKAVIFLKALECFVIFSHICAHHTHIAESNIGSSRCLTSPVPALVLAEGEENVELVGARSDDTRTSWQP